MRRLFKRREEGGAILIMAAAGLVVMTISAALAVDIGRLGVERRKVQSVVDMAALDAVRDLPNMNAVARQAATRNSWNPDAAEHTFSVEPVGAMGVRVTATSRVKYAFQPGSRTVRGTATAELYDEAGFSLGSSLATLNSSQSTLLNPIIGSMIGGTLNLSLVSWQGLAGANSTVTLKALQTQLLALGLNVGTLDQLLNTDITLFNLYKATANALTNQGQVAAASVANTLSLAASGSAKLKLGKVFDLTQGNGTSAMGMAVNAFQLVTATAQVANGSNFISVPNVGIAVPNVSNTSLSLQVIEPPVIKYGRVGAYVTTSQVNMTVTPTLSNLPVANVAPLTNIKLNGALPVTIAAGGAKGTIRSITCTGAKSIGVGVDPQALTTASTSNVALTAQILLLTVNGTVTLNSSIVTDVAESVLSFAHPTEFVTMSKHAGSTATGLNALPTASTVTATLVGQSVPLGLGGAAATALSPTLGNVDNNIVRPLMSALGLELGGGDVSALGLTCGLFGLAS